MVPRNRILWTLLATLITCTPTLAQDNVRGRTEPIVSSIDPSKLAYDILVDGNLDRDDPAKMQFKTLQAAYAAAQPGTEQKRTVIGIKPNLYLLPSDTSPSLRVTKNYVTFLGLTNNRRSVVLADNRGLQQGADDDGYILDVDAVGFTLKNLTIINYCNTDYEYPGDPRKNLTKRSNVITQAVALQASGDKHVYENVALLSRLDTMFLRTTRSYFKNVYIEGTDDWMGGGQISVWEDSTLVYPTGSGVMSASNVVFRHCRFEATNGMQFYKAEYGGAARPNVLIDSIVPVASVQSPVAWVRGKAAPRPSVFSLTYHDKDAAGNPAVLYDSNMGDPTFTYSRELSDQEVRAYNPWNLLRATPNGAVDDWDPAGVKQQYETAGEGNLVYRMNVTGSGVTIRTGGAGTTLGAAVTPNRQADAVITWSTQSDLVSLDKATGPSVVVTARNTTSKPQWVPITAALSNGFRVTAYVHAEPRYIDPPALTSTPRLSAPRNGTVSVDYSLDLGAHEDQSLVSWAICDDSACSTPRNVAVSRGNEPLKSIKLLPGFSGKFIKVTVQPKIEISEAGAAVSASSATPIAATAVPSANVSLNARSLVTDPVDSIARGVWTIQGPWSVAAEEEVPNGYGVRSGNGPAWILYREDVERGDMQIDLFMTPEKTEGQGFSVPGSPSETGPRNLHSDVYIKYDPRTKNGYALRFWRTTLSASKVMFQLYEVVNGVGKPIDERQVLSGVLKPSTKMTLKITASKFTVDASNTDDTETLHLEGTIKPNRFGGAGVFWPGGSTNAYSRIDVSYAGN